MVRVTTHAGSRPVEAAREEGIRNELSLVGESGCGDLCAEAVALPAPSGAPMYFQHCTNLGLDLDQRATQGDSCH